MHTTRWLYLGAVLLAAACGTSDGGQIDIVYDPCVVTQLEAAPGTSESERASIAAAVDMWHEVSDIAVTVEPRSGLTSIPISSEDAAPMFYGVYRDDVGDIVINRQLLDEDQRAVVVAHELGHAFGLLHDDDPRSVMQPGNVTTPPSDYDVWQLRTHWGACSTE